METWVLLVAIIVFFFAGFIQSLAGFGFSLVSIPILIILIDPKLLIPAIIIHGTVINISLFLKVRVNVQPGRIAPLIVAAIAGIPIGTWILIVVDQDIFKLFVGLLIMLFGIAFLMNFRILKTGLSVSPPEKKPYSCCQEFP